MKKSVIPYPFFCFLCFCAVPVFCLTLSFEIEILDDILHGDYSFLEKCVDAVFAIFLTAFNFLFISGVTFFYYSGARLIRINETGITQGVVLKKTYVWEDIVCYGLAPSLRERGPSSGTGKNRSIYLIFHTQGENPTKKHHIQAIGTLEMILQGIFNKYKVLHCMMAKQHETDISLDELVIPEKFVAMQYSPERFAFIMKYVEKYKGKEFSAQ